MARFQREAQAASALNHPNICTIYEIGEQDGQAFIAMEFLDGVTLKHRIAGRPLETEILLVAGDRNCRCARCGALRRHRSPRHQAREHLRHQARSRQDSRLRTGEGHVRQPVRRATIAAANTQTGSVDEEHLTSPGSTLGTVAYMSPEQVRAKELDARTDLFSFGAVLYEMATGTLPFRGESSGVIFREILDRDPVPAVRLNPDLPPSWNASSTRHWRKTANLRYQHASEMRADLQRLKRDTETGRAKAASSGTVAVAQESGSQVIQASSPVSGSSCRCSIFVSERREGR